MTAALPYPRSRPVARLLAVAVLLLLPLAALWNLALPAWSIRAGTLSGVTNPAPPVAWSWHSVADKRLQDSLARGFADLLPFRPLLIRLNNEARYDLFGYVSTPHVVEGTGGHLVEPRYIEEYCARGPETAERKAAEVIPKLRDIQEHLRRQGRVFFYLITPSKAAHMPDRFVGRLACASTVRDREAYLPTLTARLREAGIPYLDAASLTHALRGRYEVEVFPPRGIHWNNLAVAHTAQALIARINELSGREMAPVLAWNHRIRDFSEGMDLDMDHVLNLLVPRTGDPSPVVSYTNGGQCEGSPALALNAAMVGSSFIGQPGGALIYESCFKRLTRYHYLWQYREGGDPAQTRVNLTPEELLPLRDAELLIVEENESFVTESNYIGRLRDLLLAGG